MCCITVLYNFYRIAFTVYTPAVPECLSRLQNNVQCKKNAFMIFAEFQLLLNRKFSDTVLYFEKIS